MECSLRVHQRGSYRVQKVVTNAAKRVILYIERLLLMYNSRYDDTPYKVINFLGAKINYGGRVTDDKDVILINVILKTYINKDALRDGFAFSPSGTYQSIPAGKMDDYIKYISSLPLNPEPEAFGLHENAEITNSQN